jgi:CheY-like chemotaxis protein
MPTLPKVLIIDDDRQLNLLLESYLREAEYPTVTAVDAIQGFMLAQREIPGLILLDVKIPAGGGLALLERLAKTTRTQRIPVIVITAHPEPEIEAQARAMGAAAFLRKPLARDTLLDTIAKLVTPA